MLPTLICADREYSPTWLQQEITRIANGLHAHGLRSGDVAAAMLRNGPEYLVLVQACRQAGVFLVAVNWHFKGAETRYILEDSAARALFVHDDLLEQIDGGVPSDVLIVPVPASSPLQAPAAAGMTAPAASAGQVPSTAQATASPAWPAFGRDCPPAPAATANAYGSIFYTSGTTGRPKGVRRLPLPAQQRAEKERQMMAMSDIVYGSGPDMAAYLAAPIYHSAAMAYLVHACRLADRLVLESRFDAQRTLELIERHRITHAYLVPTMYQRLLALPATTRARHDVSSLRHVASTGSPCAVPLKKAMIDWFGPVITEAYGSSEAGYTTFIDSADWLRHPGSAGRALPNASVQILDDEGRQVPQGTIGLIHVRQHALPDFTYVNQPDARAAAERDGLVTLGDLGYLDEAGFLYICDRKSDMVISGGVNIYPAEIESVLQTMPGVADCAVFGIPDAEFGEGLAAAVQTHPGVSLTADDIQAFVRERLANYKVPRRVDFHTALPREDSGKIFKRRLREPFWQGAQRAI